MRRLDTYWDSYHFDMCWVSPLLYNACHCIPRETEVKTLVYSAVEYIFEIYIGSSTERDKNLT